METLTIITTLSTFLSLGINYYFYKKMHIHAQHIGLNNHNIGLIASILKENNDRMIKNNEILIEATNKIIKVEQNQETN